MACKYARFKTGTKAAHATEVYKIQMRLHINFHLVVYFFYIDSSVPIKPILGKYGFDYIGLALANYT